MNSNKKTKNYNTSCYLDPPHTLHPDSQKSALFIAQPAENTYCLYQAIFQFYEEKSSEDADVSELYGSAPPHPVRCPSIIFTGFITQYLRWNGKLEFLDFS